MRHNMEILLEKELYNQAGKMIKKAKQVVSKNEILWAMPEIEGVWEIKLALANNDMDWLKNIITDKTENLLILQNAEQYRDINFRMYMIYSETGKVRGQQNHKEIRKIMSMPQMKNESAALSFEAKMRFHLTYALFADLQGNSDQYYVYSKKIIDLFKANPEKSKNYLSQLIAYYGNIIGSCMNSFRYKEATIYLNELKQLSQITNNDALSHKLYYYVSHLTLYYFNTTGEFPNKTNSIPEIVKWLTDHYESLNDIQKSVMLSNLATAFFIQQQYHKSIFWINRARNEISLTNYPNIQSLLRIFYLIVNYEAGKTDLLPYLIQSTYRFLKKKKQLYKFESFLIDFLKKILKANSTQKIQTAFRKFYAQIKPLSKDPYEKNAFEYFDYLTWLECKIENRRFKDGVREKAGLK